MKSLPRVDSTFILGFVLTMLSLSAFVWVTRSPSAEPLKPDFPTELLATAKNVSLVRERGFASAPDTLLEVSDLMCAACASQAQRFSAQIDSLVADGLLFHQVIDLPMQVNSMAVTAYANCVSLHAPSLYWVVRQETFSAQATLVDAYPIEDVLAKVGANAGADTIAALACLGPEVARLRSLKQDLGRASSDDRITQTPTYYFNGRNIAGGALAQVLQLKGS